jgi:hypothetical protein
MCGFLTRRYLNATIVAEDCIYQENERIKANIRVNAHPFAPGWAEGLFVVVTWRRSLYAPTRAEALRQKISRL